MWSPQQAKQARPMGGATNLIKRRREAELHRPRALLPGAGPAQVPAALLHAGRPDGRPPRARRPGAWECAGRRAT